MKKKNKRAMVAYYSDILFNTFRNIDIAHFIPLDNKLQKLIVAIDPVQDLHGYDNPWPDGGGKNKFDASLFETDTAGAIMYTHYDVPNGTYTMSTPDFPLVSGIANVFFKEGLVTGGVTSASDGVTTSSSRTITVTDGHYTVAYRSTQADNTNNPKNFKWQIESGSTSSTWAPFSNICPITGHSSVNVIVSTSTNPLDGTITNIPLGQTVYGGTLDVLTGVLTVTHGIYTFSENDVWDSYSTAGKVTFNSGSRFPPNIDTTKDGIMSNYPFYKISYIGGQMNKSFCFFSSPTLSVCDDAFSDVTAFATSMVGQQLVYHLATPQTIQLTPQQINTIVGSWNYVWCDSGKIIELEA